MQASLSNFKVANEPYAKTMQTVQKTIHINEDSLRWWHETQGLVIRFDQEVIAHLQGM